MLSFLKKTIKDTLAPNERFELKRVASFSAFVIGTIYAFVRLAPSIEVYYGFMAYSATAIGMNVWNKKVDK